MPIETMRWTNNCLELLDQTKLPFEVVYVQCKTSDDVISAIRAMVVRGAPAIGVAGAYGVALAALEGVGATNSSQYFVVLNSACERIAKCRPTAVNLSWAVRWMQDVVKNLGTTDPQLVSSALVAEAVSLHQQDIANNLRLSRIGASLVPKGARILTHCNAGALATAGYGTALGVIRAAYESDKSLSVIAGETRPLLQGARLTTWELLEEGISTTLISDNMAGHLMSKAEIDLVIVGADRVAENGDVANKIGTYTLAVLAERHDIPFYVACPISTIDLHAKCGAEIEIEERSAREVLGYQSVQWAPLNVKVRNPAFDVTPAELIDALITELGVIHSPNAASIFAMMQSQS